MSRHRQAILFNGSGAGGRLPVLALILTVLVSPLPFVAGCANPAGGGAAGGRFTFAVADVGQGLAQFGVAGKRAVAWDVGEQYPAWRAAYVNLGSPRIESIIISHSHADHYGALQSFGAQIDWSGELVVSPYEDTAKIRKFAVAWTDRIKFKQCARGDTLRPFGFAADIVCLWPPRGLGVETPLPDDMKNHYSLVFSVRHGGARALVTSDIDSAAMSEIAVASRYDLRAQILSVPHHGSAGSVNPLFFSYAAPSVAVISCSSDNGYGHPSPEMVYELSRWAADGVMYTYIHGTAAFNGNRYYWNY